MPVTTAKNCCVEFAPPEGGKNAYGGDTTTATFVLGAEMEIRALPLLEASASLVAVTVTGFAVGTVAGARKSTLAELAPLGARQGMEPCWQICPTNAFPFAMEFTLHVTDVSAELVTVGASVTRALVRMVAPGGDTLTVTLLTMVTAADTVEPAAAA